MTEKRPKMKYPAAIADLLTAMFHDKPAGKRLKEGKIWLVWEDSVGEQIAARARPTGFRDGTLTITVDSAPWMQQLTYMKNDIMTKINKNLEEELVKDIFLKAGSKAASLSPPALKKRKQGILSSAEKKLIAENFSSISDPELREIISSLMGKHFKNK